MPPDKLRQPTTAVPEPVARIAELMSTFVRPWCLCGGWAVDGWLGRRTREHGDQDIVVFQDDQRALFAHLHGWQLIAHDPNVADNSAEPWDGRPLDLPAHIHVRSGDAHGSLPDRLDAPAQAGFGLDVQVSARSGDDWIINGEPRITLPLHRCIQQSAWGLPTLVPEVLLFFKARELRRRDKIDFLALLPYLSDGQRGWLRDAISAVGHPWLGQLAS